MNHVFSEQRELSWFHVLKDVRVIAPQRAKRRGHVVVLQDLVTLVYALVVVEDRQRVQRLLHEIVVPPRVLDVVHQPREQQRRLADRRLEETRAHRELQEVVATVHHSSE